MKYIDAEKLKAHIQYLIKKDNYELFDVPELLSFITSLQQEQQEVEGWIARDKDGMLRMHGEKPRRSRDLWASPGASHDVSEFFSDDFIDWGDEPIEAKLVIRNARKEE